MLDLQSTSKTVLGINLLFMILLGFSLVVLEPGSESYVVALLALVPNVLTFVAAATVIYTGWSPFN